MDFENIKNLLKKKGIEITDGLTQAEFQRIESKFQIQFPPDLRAMLANFLPIKDDFVNWRDESPENILKIEDRLQWPLEGMIFDIKENNYWYYGWGKKPSTQDKAIKKCEQMFKKVPKLIPICSHRYIPMEPMEAGNPIFSVVQTDIIYYGENLEAYLRNEFVTNNIDQTSYDRVKKIRFWSNLVY
jgi:hypothetical protein